MTTNDTNASRDYIVATASAIVERVTDSRADAYSVNDGFDTEIIEPTELYDWTETAIGSDKIEVTALELVRSWDHGMRTAEELCASIIAEGADLIAGRLLAAIGLDVSTFDAFGWVVDQYGITKHYSCWTVDDPDNAQALYEHADEIESALWDAGYIVETSADAGMTWLYAPIR